MASKQAVQSRPPETEIDLINTEMEAKGISINALADQAGIPYATLRRSLKGARAINLLELRSIAGAIGIPPSHLLPEDLIEARHVA